jgi:hypothetical protein
MHSTTRTNRFQSFTPLRSSTGTSLRRLRTAFSPSRSISSSSSISISSANSPLTRNSSPHSYTSATSIREMLSLRRKPSVLEFEMEEERHLFSSELELLEPRPSMGRGGSEGHVAGIFEVLDGKF